ncbi:hypothetical protein TCAL_02182 [Tigriopus californicus]|uniref:Equilibrative nucleoside transporter 3 n=1 Tax=Tigriopus californicus TaxID=6832 RepID=A0A553NUP0_TIGCA|nr:equilibrative nucleoside transporter 1-like [Tigriopus californicus]TRY69151.1 hypothetical protein TCAL_02182 [Tigriopus californicus]|eukprot:TCALIF_02182-PA protein Name:"Similar to Slc29a1 Equilibrative nucleoside transporter 1 (Rattus norvegicus)" AED:0.26 eAED:0.30 QI:0/-1/0/1/-1/1/1/0/513
MANAARSGPDGFRPLLALVLPEDEDLLGPDEIREVELSSDSEDDNLDLLNSSEALIRRHHRGSRRTQSESTEEDPLLGRSEPSDPYFMVYFVFYLLGMGTLLPWNFFISVSSFWNYKFREVTNTSSLWAIQNGTDLEISSHQTALQEEFTSYLAIASNIPNAMFVILNALVGQNFQLKYRIFVSLGLVIGFFGIVLVFSETNSDDWQKEFMVLILILVVLINCCSAIFQGGVFGVAGKFPPKYMGSIMAGQAMGGVFPALVDIVVISANVQAKDTGFACFLIATLCLIASFVSFAWVRRTKFFKFYAETPLSLSRQPDLDVLVPVTPSIFTVFTKSWHYCLAIYVTFSTTLAVFPAITVLIQSRFNDHDPTSKSWADLYFTPVTCFLLFNVGDYLGRILSSRLKWPGPNRRGKLFLLMASILRIGFIPLFMFCNVAPDRRSLPVVFHSDMVYVLFMATFAVSNGYLGNICMLHGPKLFHSSELQESAAMMLVACLVLGTSTGSFLSYPIVSLI